MVLTSQFLMAGVPEAAAKSRAGHDLPAPNTQVQPSSEYTPTQPMEEIVVEGELPDVDDMNSFEVIHYYNANARGGQLYKMRRYDDAKPFLEVGAQLGFKMSQARLGAIYAYGLGTTERDAVKGITWIGVAAEPRTDPTITKHYRDLLKQIPPGEMPKIEAMVAEGRAKYGSSATGTNCQMIRSAGSHMSWLNCEVKDMYRFRSAADAYHLCLIQGIESIQSDGEMAAISVTPCS
ncbi:MAG: hypothetical protein F4W90_07020 [Gammaproteobacteria bacterium]|nr:hypothetical protein [Gammaproteobacteria bacterium]